ncbi:protein TUNAR isoform X1 [Rhineura floridana]|uniref:protein TUNAR isoform X1 n=1 Tax=Rhineura floridana TaxID=261503 RepID=UPI002AC81143|nr:protein TUNAR isoform X1 [Rhineura floridana]
MPSNKGLFSDYLSIEVCPLYNRMHGHPSTDQQQFPSREPVEVSLRRGIKKLATKMVITSGNEEEKNNQEKESKEESILAMLGIIGTILNLVVIIFVYIYTTL